MAGRTMLGLAVVGGLAVAAAGVHVYKKCKNFITEVTEAKEQNEINKKTIETQNQVIEALGEKLKRLGG